ncbi:MAG TPA: hypothetical protein VFM18_11420, partial [Methanosarcina sp.]|nr:hypothetical protein [Methanosarcina sp.]
TLYLAIRVNDISRARGALALNLRGLIDVNRDFAIYGSFQEMVSVTAYYAPLLLFSAKYGDATGGQYAMASRLVWAPTILISGSYAQVLLHRFGKVAPKNPNELMQYLPGRRIVLTFFFVFFVACILANYAEVFVGQKWAMAGHMLSPLVLWGGVFLLSTPHRVLIRVFRLQKYQLIVDFGAISLFGLMYAKVDFSAVNLLWLMLVVAIIQNAALIKLVVCDLR